MYAFLNFLRSVVWTAVAAVALTISAILTALTLNDPFLSLTLGASAIAMAVLSTRVSS